MGVRGRSGPWEQAKWVSCATRLKPARVLVADDHAVLRAALRRLLAAEAFEVVAEAGDGSEAVALAQATRPDLALIDLAMPGIDGLEATRQICETCSETRVVILSGFVDPDRVALASRAGAAGYIAKPATFAQMLGVLGAVLEGRHAEAVAGVEMGGRVAEASPPGTLSCREREVLHLVAEGYSSANAATVLGLSVRTVETHRLRIMNKLRVHSVAGLTRFAIEHGV
jgi:two-component system, NarL family, response regulator NreC